MSTVFDQTGEKKKSFVKNFKKYKKGLYLKISEILNNKVQKDDACAEDMFYVIVEVLHYIDDAESMWNAVDPYKNPNIGKAILYQALLDSMQQTSMDLIKQGNDLDMEVGRLAMIPDQDPALKAPDPDDDDDSLAAFSLLNVNGDDFFYHATPTKNLSSIQQNGLIATSRRHVYLHDAETNAINVAGRHGDQDITLMRIAIDNLQIRNIKMSREDFGYGDVIMTGNIPADIIEYRDDLGQWDFVSNIF